MYTWEYIGPMRVCGLSAMAARTIIRFVYNFDGVVMTRHEHISRELVHEAFMIRCENPTVLIMYVQLRAIFVYAESGV